MDADRLRVDAVIVEEILEIVFPVRDAADHGAHGALRPVEDAGAGLGQCRGADAVGELADVRLPHRQRGQLRLQVAPEHVGPADVLLHHRQQVVIEGARLDQLQRRDAQPLLEDLGRRRGIGAGRHAAHVEMMAERADDGDAAPLGEDRAEGQDVGDVLAAAIGIVGDDDIAILPALQRQVVAQHGAQARAHRVQVLRDARRLRDIVAMRVEDRRGIIQQLAHDGGAAGAPDGDIHLGGGGGQGVAQDFQRDRVEMGAHAARASVRPALWRRAISVWSGPGAQCQPSAR